MVFGGGDKYDGGAGFDRVQVTDSDVTVTYDPAKFIGVEMIDIGDGQSNDNTFALNASDLGVGNFGTIGSGGNAKQISLFVIGDNTGGERDDVNLQGFTSTGVSGNFTDAATGVQHTFNVYTGMNQAHQTVNIAVEAGLAVHTS
jgi:hypothetical protein